LITDSEPKVSAVDTVPTAKVLAGDYLNKISGEQIERECRQRLNEGCKLLVLDFSKTEVVNSIGVSILLGVIDRASDAGAKVVFSEVNEHTVELFEMLGVANHVTFQN
jgi:anti-anti-sigma regulatory factor